MTPEQIQRLREMAEPLAARAKEYARQAAASDNAGLAGIARLEASMGARAAMDASALRSAAAIADAYRWRPVGEYGTDEDTDQIVWGKLSHDGFLLSDSQLSKVAAVAYGYTHFFRLPKLEAPNA